jgi:hypothetical protein
MVAGLRGGTFLHRRHTGPGSAATTRSLAPARDIGRQCPNRRPDRARSTRIQSPSTNSSGTVIRAGMCTERDVGTVCGPSRNEGVAGSSPAVGACW